MQEKFEWNDTASELLQELVSLGYSEKVATAVFGKRLEEDKLTLLSLHGIDLSSKRKNIKQEDGNFLTRKIIYLKKNEADSRS
jgi:hypothetical protein